VGEPFHDEPGQTDAGSVLLFSGRTAAFFKRVVHTVPTAGDWATVNIGTVAADQRYDAGEPSARHTEKA